MEFHLDLPSGPPMVLPWEKHWGGRWEPPMEFHLDLPSGPPMVLPKDILLFLYLAVVLVLR